jgi:hypothetical protein
MRAAKRIPLTKLMAKLADPATTERDLRPYLIPAPTGQPYAPYVTFDPASVELPAGAAGAARSAVALDILNGWCRRRRRERYESRIASGYSGSVLVAEGDSWFQYPVLLEDVVDGLSADYAVLSLDAAGDTLAHMITEREFVAGLRSSGAKILLFSGGGNDLLAGGALAEHLSAYDPTRGAAAHIRPSFGTVLAEVLGLYDRLFRLVGNEFPDITIIGHGYDRPVPRRNGPWLGGPMQSRGIVDPIIQQAIAGLLIDRFNEGLKRVAAVYPKVRILDLRGTLGANDWYDELHPSDDGFRKVTAQYRAEIEKTLHPVAAPAHVRARGRRRAIPENAPAVVGGRRGLSLHIGLATVDPRHYAGWSGALGGPEHDAADMATLAAAAGYDSRKLLTKAATAKAVLGGLADAARDLKSGDILLLTYAGHGSLRPDYDRDEDDGADETWCLYDRQLIDDELYEAWRKFQPGVRILVVSDSCHSGTVVRAAPVGVVLVPSADADGLAPSNPTPRLRGLPPALVRRIRQDNRAVYAEVRAKLPPRRRADGLDRRVTAPLAATVRLISGCQDNQQSMDLGNNGAFTFVLLEVWDDGRFSGDYARFVGRIRRRLPPTQVPEHMVIGQADPIYDRQKPFAI